VVGRALAEAGTTPKYRPGLGESAEDLWSGFSTAPERTCLEGSVHRDHDAQPIGQCLVRVAGRPRQPLRPEANAPCPLPPLLLCLTCLAPSLDVRWSQWRLSVCRSGWATIMCSGSLLAAWSPDLHGGTRLTLG
jgi:hypothetical protein